MTEALILAGIAGGIFAVTMVFIAGMWAGESIARRDAIEAGAAEWSVNPKTGERTFRYKGRA